jgi:hypothetical protein
MFTFAFGKLANFQKGITQDARDLLSHSTQQQQDARLLAGSCGSCGAPTNGQKLRS